MRSSRRTVVLLALAAGLVLLIATTQTWVRASGLGETSALQSVEIAGSDIARGVTALALVVLAGAVAVTIARRIARLIIGVLMLAAAVISGWSVLQVILDPAEAAGAALGEVTGTTEFAQSYDTAPAVWAALVAAALLLLTSVVLLLASGRWEESRRHSSTAEEPAAADAEEVDEFDLWDGLSAGEDPTQDPTQDEDAAPDVAEWEAGAPHRRQRGHR